MYVTLHACIHTLGETGLVGTAMYMAPELLKNQLKYTQVRTAKVFTQVITYMQMRVQLLS